MPARRPFRRGLLTALLVLAAAAAHAAPPAAGATGDRAAAVEAPLDALPYTPGLDLAALDRTADPCADFYRFSCGGWQRLNPIPPDQAEWDVYRKLQQDNLRYLWGLLVDAAEDRPGRSEAQQQIGDYFAACMDRAAIDAAGGAPIAPLLARIAALPSRRAAAPLVAELHRAGLDAMFSFGSEQDFTDSTRVIAGADAGGVGLPDREQYLRGDAASRALRAAYRAHVVRLFVLAGDAPADAEAAARTVLAMETALARATLSRESQRDPRRLFHRLSTAQLARLAPRFDWAAYLRAAGVPAGTAVNVAQPRFFAALDRLLQRHPLADWQAYLRWQVVNGRAPDLATPFAEASFDFYGRRLRGTEALPARWKLCVRWVDRDLGEALGQVFVSRTFAPATRERVATLAHAVAAALAERIEALPWMTAATRREARAKLDAVVHKIGYPERWRSYEGLVIRRDDFAGNVTRSRAFETRRQIAKIGRPADRAEWEMTPPTVNAYYDMQLNSINVPAGILQPPLYDPHMDDAPNYGNTGSTIGHELTHGFDDAGRHFDAQGNLRDWWTPRDAAAFAKRTECLVEQYSAYPIVDDLRINGRLTLGEDVADLGGATLAFLAWQAGAAGRAQAPRDGFTPEQRFFIGMAQWACSNERPEVLRLHALTEVHSPNRWRVNGVVSNMPEFARAFACRPGQPMVRARPCRVW